MMSKLKETLKKNSFIFEMHQKWQKAKFQMVSSLSPVAPALVSKIRYKNVFGKKLDLKNPKTFNEKLMWLKLNQYANDPLVSQCSDKYAVREYVEKCGLGHTLNDLLGAWDHAEEIPWQQLPERFAIKCNHGCGYNLICQDKSGFDTKKAEAQLNAWMKDDFWKEYAEVHYRTIPKKIICEKYLEGKGNALPVDFKIYCFNGEPVYIGNFIERDIVTDEILRGYFTLDWKPSPVFCGEMQPELFERPKTLETMLEYARILAKPFPFVRVDFYEVDGKIYFGELTFTPTGCLATYYTDEAQMKLGELLHVKS